MRRSSPAATIRCKALSTASRLPRATKSDGTQTSPGAPESISAEMEVFRSDMQNEPFVRYLYMFHGRCAIGSTENVCKFRTLVASAWEFADSVCKISASG